VKRFRHNRYVQSVLAAAVIGLLTGCPRVEPSVTPTGKSASARKKSPAGGNGRVVYVPVDPSTPMNSGAAPAGGLVYAPVPMTSGAAPPSGLVYAPVPMTSGSAPPTGPVYVPAPMASVSSPPSGFVYPPPPSSAATSLPPGVVVYRPSPPGPPASKTPPAPPSGKVPAVVEMPSERVSSPPDEPPVWKLAPIKIDLPAPAFRGTPKPQAEPNVEKPLGKPRPDFLAPQGTINLALGKKVTGSDSAPSSGEYDLVTDDDKEATDFGYVKLRSGTQWIQIDLEQRATIYAVLIWHNHAEARVYRDVIVQVSDEPDFLNAKTVFNNDYDNSSGLGIGEQMGYVETSEGKLIDCRGVEGRYVRCYSNGNTHDAENHYTEVAVYGRPAR